MSLCALSIEGDKARWKRVPPSRTTPDRGAWTMSTSYTLNVFQEVGGRVIWMQNTTLPWYVLLERLGFAAAAAAVDTVAHFYKEFLWKQLCCVSITSLGSQALQVDAIVSILRPTSLRRGPRFYFDHTGSFLFLFFVIFHSNDPRQDRR